MSYLNNKEFHVVYSDFSVIIPTKPEVVEFEKTVNAVINLAGWHENESLYREIVAKRLAGKMGYRIVQGGEKLEQI